MLGRVVQTESASSGEYEAFFARAHGGEVEPYPYQVALARAQAGTDVLIAPTGLGKTAAVTLAWAWDRSRPQPTLPPRLVWCLPMRTLVEQTAEVARGWMLNLEDDFAEVASAEERKRAAERAGLGKEKEPFGPQVHVLMGGAVDKDWRLRPERPAILVGTQDMLLSRALMRGYGMSRFGWPIDYGLLHTDALWVFDEVQLMGAGLPTSTQLEGFRRRWAELRRTPSSTLPPRPSDGPPLARSLWVSATLAPAWLKSAEFPVRQVGQEPPVFEVGGKPLRVARWDDGSAPEPPALTARLDAVKRLRRADTTLTAEAAKDPGKYAAELAREVAAAHQAGTTTLVIVNTVRRAQAIHAALAKAAPGVGRLLIHSRFRRDDRKTLTRRLREEVGADRIVVATQAVEAGVDLTSATLFTELGPWSSLIQRFGRCNRGGERTEHGGAEVVWIDAAEPEDAEKLAAASKPYDAEPLTAARALLAGLEEVSPRKLPAPSAPPSPGQVIRPKDFEELFDTDSDLSGYDLDVSPYIRDGDDLSVSLFWRDLERLAADEQGAPTRAELCPAPLSGVRDLLKNKGDLAFVEAPNGTRRGAASHWVKFGDRGKLRPGMTLMLDARLGGYAPATGFDPVSKAPVRDLSVDTSEAAEAETAPGARTDDDDHSRATKRAVTLTEHLTDVAREAVAIARAVGLEEGDVAMLGRAGGWHDVGKAHEEFRRRMGVGEGEPSLAKGLSYISKGSKRRFFRHELASALAFLAQHDGAEQADMIAFLVAAHHGKVRMGLRTLADEKPEQHGLRIVRGVQDRDTLPEVRWSEDGVDRMSQEGPLSLDLMAMGEDEMGRPSWAARTQALLAAHGPFRLAYLEALLRMADWRASADEQDRGGPLQDGADD